MADMVGILNHGRLLFEGTMDELRRAAMVRGLPVDNLEDTFLAMIENDDASRAGAAGNGRRGSGSGEASVPEKERPGDGS